MSVLEMAAGRERFTSERDAKYNRNKAKAQVLGPPAPPSLSQTASGTSGVISCAFLPAKTPGILGYCVYRSNTGQPNTGRRISFIGQPSTQAEPLTITDSPPDYGTYYYWVSSINIMGAESTRIGLGSASISSANTFPGAIRYADAFPGADWGEKVRNALLDLPAIGGTVDARGLEGAQTATANPFAGITWPFTLLIGFTTVTTTAPFIITKNGQNVIGCNYESSVIVYTGGVVAEAFLIDGTLIPNFIRFTLRDLSIRGNANNTSVLTIKTAARFTVENVAVANSGNGGIGFNCSLCVLGTFINPICSSNIAGIVPAEKGMSFTALSSDNVIINPIMEGITTGVGIGIYDDSFSNNYLGGSSEYNKIGYHFTANSLFYAVIGGEEEGNTTYDFLVDGQNGTLNCVTAQSNTAGGCINLKINGSVNNITGGLYDKINVAVGAGNNRLIGTYTRLGIVNSSSTTVIAGDCYDGATGFVTNIYQANTAGMNFQNNAGATKVFVKSGSSQGANEHFRVTDGAGNGYISVDSALDFNTRVLRLWNGSSSVWHMILDGSNGLQIVRSGVSLRYTITSGGDIIPNAAATQYIGDSTHRINIYGQDADFANAVTIGIATASKPAFYNASKVLISQDINLAASYVTCTNGATTRTLIGAATASSITAGSFTTVDGKTVNYNAEGVITSVV